MSYHPLTQAQRYQIYALKKTSHSGGEIAEVLGVHKSTVSRELRRNHVRLMAPRIVYDFAYPAMGAHNMKLIRDDAQSLPDGCSRGIHRWHSCPFGRTDPISTIPLFLTLIVLLLAPVFFGILVWIKVFDARELEK